MPVVDELFDRSIGPSSPKDLSMLRTDRHLPRLLGFSAAIAALLLSSTDAHAQFDMGMGMGGFFGFHQVPSPTGYLNQAALAAANRPREGVPSRNPYANNPNSFINKLRDPGFQSTYDVRRRRPPSYQPRTQLPPPQTRASRSHFGASSWRATPSCRSPVSLTLPRSSSGPANRPLPESSRRNVMSLTRQASQCSRKPNGR